ncbi:MAG TPA: hypothetical protein VLB27_08455 [candidate division Zixibacteria bacterium]|nr:hypothetical protein [candidate division Zixibacteria bacterium]
MNAANTVSTPESKGCLRAMSAYGENRLRTRRNNTVDISVRRPPH